MIKFIVIKSSQELAKHLNKSFERLSQVMQEIDVAKDLQNCVQQHFTQKYPSSKHWDPNKVTISGKNKIHIAVPGVMRAYRDVVIKPIHAKHLSIPLHAEAYGKSPRDVKGLFPFWHTKSGGLCLAQRDFNSIIPWFALVDEVHQHQDSTLMPTDQELANTVITRILKSMKGPTRKPWL